MATPKIKDVSVLSSAFDAVNWLEKRIAYDANDNPIYIGWSKPGTGAGVGGWFITKLTWTAGTVSGFNNTNIRTASDEVLFDKIWDDRATYFV